MAGYVNNMVIDIPFCIQVISIGAVEGIFSPLQLASPEMDKAMLVGSLYYNKI